jgi:hypothetical protein
MPWTSYQLESVSMLVNRSDLGAQTGTSRGGLSTFAFCLMSTMYAMQDFLISSG